MSVPVSLERGTRELLTVVILVPLVLASAWVARWGFRRSGLYPLVAGAVAGVIVVGVIPIRTKADAVARRIYEAVPYPVLWLCYLAVSSVLSLFNRTVMDPWAPLIAAVSAGLVLVWTREIAASLRKLVDVLNPGDTTTG